MALLSYEKIFSRVRNKINDPKELTLDDDDLYEIYAERLHSVVGNVRIRNKFSTLKCNDETEEIEWIIKNSETNTSDKDDEEDFVVELLSLGMVIEWLQPKVDDIVYISKAIGGKEEKVINDNHKRNIERLDSLKIQLSKMLRDHGYLYNSYLQE